MVLRGEGSWTAGRRRVKPEETKMASPLCAMFLHRRAFSSLSIEMIPSIKNTGQSFERQMTGWDEDVKSRGSSKRNQTLAHSASRWNEIIESLKQTKEEISCKKKLLHQVHMFMKFHSCRHSTWPYNVCWMKMWEPLKTAIDCSASTGWLKGFGDPCDHARPSFIAIRWFLVVWNGRNFVSMTCNMKGQWPCSPMLRYLIRCADIARSSLLSVRVHYGPNITSSADHHPITCTKGYC